MTLLFHNLLPLCCNLIRSHIIRLHDLLVGKLLVHALSLHALILLVDQTLSCFAKDLLLLSILLKVLLVRETFLCNCPQHVITLTILVESFDILLLLLQTRGLIEFFVVVSSLLRAVHLLDLLLALEHLCLAFDDGTPLVWIALAVRRVVPITLLSECLHRACLGF